MGVTGAVLLVPLSLRTRWGVRPLGRHRVPWRGGGSWNERDEGRAHSCGPREDSRRGKSFWCRECGGGERKDIRNPMPGAVTVKSF